MNEGRNTNIARITALARANAERGGGAAALLPVMPDRIACLLYLSEGLGTAMCNPESYVDEECPDVRKVDLLPEDQMDDLLSSRWAALHMLRYAHASGFTKTGELARLLGGEQIEAAIPLADEMFATVHPGELLAYLEQCSKAAAALAEGRRP